MRTPLAIFRRWYDGHSVSFWIGSLVLLLLLLYLLPSIIITIPPGHGAVLWRRFDYFGLVQDGTATDFSYTEGTHWKLPWDRTYDYDLRIRDATVDFAVLMNDGLRVDAEVTIRFRPIQDQLGNLHKYVGLDYEKRLVEPELLRDARSEMAKLSPVELYSSKRAETEQAIYRSLTEEFEIRFEPQQAVFGINGRVRRTLLTLLADSQMPLSAADLIQLAGLNPGESIDADLAVLVNQGLVTAAVVNGVQTYRINSLRFANGESVNDLLGSGVPMIFVEDVLIRNIDLPADIAAAIQRKLSMQQEMEEYDYRVQREAKESERKRIEAQGIRQFQDIVTGGISDRYLKWRGIDATLQLAQSPNSKVVVIGSAKDGLPIILGGLDAPGGSVQLSVQPPALAAAPSAPAAGQRPPAPATARPTGGGNREPNAAPRGSTNGLDTDPAQQ